MSENTQQLSDRYDPKNVEAKLYKWWEEKKYFKAEDSSTKPPYCVILPPPNVTGSLHLGHALDHTIQDCLIRWKRMSGFNTLWLPGTDHAGIATQTVVEKQLDKQGLSRKEMGREAFLEKVWDWKNKNGDHIVKQMKRLGDSCDWDRLTFTLDDNVSDAVKKVFVNLYKKGVIYRAKKLINWSPKLESALSNAEVDHKDVSGHLWHIKYPVDGENQKFITVATTRPETMLGDTAVAVHPDDERYEDLVGQFITLPIVNRKIPIIADKYVEKEFGSGAVKITPGHDFNDEAMGKRHNLEIINLLNPDGTMNENAGNYKGLKVKKAREQIVADLEELGFLVKIEKHKQSVGHCSRTNCVVEPYLSEQWFVKVDDLKGNAKRAVESGTTSFVPENQTKVYFNWMNIMEDWCVSRQLWWGHQIPAWYCKSCDYVSVVEKAPEKCEGCGATELKQDEDVLDTWFSSGLWPFSTLGWPEETEALKTFYPSTVLVTGYDIIFFWVARMMMMGLEFKKDVPFRTVYLHGLVRNSNGSKMSKSDGTAVDPIEIIDSNGADALRFTLLSQVMLGRDLKFSSQRLDGYRNFMNKIWNAARFSLNVLGDFPVPAEGDQALVAKTKLSDADQWIIYKLGQCEKEVNSYLEEMNFSGAAKSVYTFIWNQLCDWYLEFIKPVVYGENLEEKQATQLVLAQTLNRAMRLLHPFAPFISEEIYQKLPIKKESVVIDQFPTVTVDKSWLDLGSEEVANKMDLVCDVITAIRNIRGENRISPAEKIHVKLLPQDDKTQKVLGENKSYIMNIARLAECQIGAFDKLSKCAMTPVSKNNYKVDVVVQLEGLVDFDEEIKRLEKLMDKKTGEITGIEKRLSNESFVKNAPADIVEQANKQLVELRAQTVSLKESLDRLH